jgi:radical SAM protein with 4Fe4S-binding SPASM domain
MPRTQKVSDLQVFRQEFRIENTKDMKIAQASTKILAPRAITPKVGWLTVNRECNFRCQWCYAKGTEFKPSDNMSLKLAVELLHSMKQNGVRRVTLIGGEPTLWEPLTSFTQICRDEDIQTVLVSNGTRFGIDSFWQSYLEQPVDRIGLSIKSFDPESHKCVTGKSNFELTKRGIERALSLKSTSASIVFTGENVEEILQLARFGASVGAKRLSISPSTPAFINGKADVGFVTDPKKFIAAVVTVYDELDSIFNGELSLSVKLPLCLWPRDFILKMIDRNQILTSCQLQHRTGILYDPKGKLISCNSLHDFPIGQWGVDFSDSETLATHIKSERVVNFYDKMTTYASTKCETCSMSTQCGGGCPLFYSIYDAKNLIPGWD